ncbi:ABC transporter substrate-binding protein [Paenibacillus kobensis]|uniref:ABC transporter substrate-binding protein n=1 Tax=Paenibacillus kobensis TaxID=59841 RepID=UPI000FDABC38|nr:extracellular solute-binding protein [Paenibacillus kobensis]
MSGQEQLPYWERQLVEQPLSSGGFTSEIERKVRERIRMEQRNSKPRAWIRTAAAFTAVAVLLGGGWLLRDDIGAMLEDKPNKQSGIPAALQNDTLADLDVTLKVMETEYDNFTNMQYARPFLLHHPSVGIETVMFKQDDKIDEWTDKEQPDVLRLNSRQYYELVQKGKLQPLDALIRNNKVDVDAMYEPIINILRQYGGGQLYGLTANFNTNVVYVNKTLFEKNGIPLPREGATWEELMDTAARFQGTGIAGLAASNYNDRPYYLFDMIRRSVGLQTDTQGGERVTVDSPAWADWWQRIAAGYQDGWLYRDADKAKKKGESFTPSDAFLKGKAAMTINGTYYIQQINQVWTGDKQQEWMTIPVPGNRTQDLSMSEIYAIPANVSSEKAAWEFVKFMTGKEFAKRLIGLGMSGGVPIRQADLSGENQERMAAFYEGKLELPDNWTQYMGMEKQSSDTLAGKAYDSGGALLDAVVEGQLTVEKALAELKEKLEQEAAAAKKESS